MRDIRVFLPLYNVIHEAPKISSEGDTWAAFGQILRREREGKHISHGVGGKTHLQFLTPSLGSSSWLQLQSNQETPYLACLETTVRALSVGCYHLPAYMSGERSFSRSWFPNIQVVATSPVPNTCSSAVWAWSKGNSITSKCSCCSFSGHSVAVSSVVVGTCLLEVTKAIPAGWWLMQAEMTSLRNYALMSYPQSYKNLEKLNSTNLYSLQAHQFSWLTLWHGVLHTRGQDVRLLWEWMSWWRCVWKGWAHYPLKKTFFSIVQKTYCPRAHIVLHRTMTNMAPGQLQKANFRIFLIHPC